MEDGTNACHRPDVCGVSLVSLPSMDKVVQGMLACTAWCRGRRPTERGEFHLKVIPKWSLIVTCRLLLAGLLILAISMPTLT